MENTSLLTQLAENWMLVTMFTLFVGAILWALRPGTREVHNDTANIPFRNEEFPDADTRAKSSKNEELQS